ncbi:casy-1, partial [Pristionchus pacificus]|uniref:Casy-1 n=1 Tax=Pristionchus pacificus TaxID=54126 RepID=A0A2A6B9B8_PRIPA
DPINTSNPATYRMRLIPLLAAVAALAAAKHHRHRVPLIELGGADSIVGSIREDELILNTVPALAINSESGPVCAYRIINKADKTVSKDFAAEVLDRYTGQALIRVTDATKLDCKKAEYELELTASKCDEENVVSEPVPLKVTVKDTNNHEPAFEHPWYTVTVDEGKMHTEIVRVSATDADCGHPYGEVCEYQITNGMEKTPFEITKEGVIRNTAPLNASAAHSYILTVVAQDCGMRKSKSALVTVNVKKACIEGVSGVSDKQSFTSSSSSFLVAPKAEIALCPEVENKCTVKSATAELSMRLGHLQEGCGRQDAPIYTNETIKSCGLHAAAAVLLEDEATFVGDDGKEEKKLAEGAAKAHIVPVNAFDGLVPDKFALSFSMRHAAGSKQEQADKQHVLCESDDTGMNRHHFSVYVRHCKLEVVLRREAGAAAEFRAAEWRWATPEVCDDKWHSYSVLFDDIDNVSLVIDGKAFKSDERNPEILDDWPLHKTKAVKTRMVVGACWHGRTLSLAQFFKGSLANIRLLAGASETPSAISCAHACPERFQSYDDSAVFGEDKTTISFTAPTVAELQKKIQGIAYENVRASPTPGHRPVRLQTTVECTEGKTISLPELKTYIIVEKAPAPILSISGAAEVSATQKQLQIGTAMVPGLKLTVSVIGEDGETEDVTSDRKLDSCKVHLKPARDMDLEYFSSPATLIASTHIDFEHDKQGIVLRGEEWASVYQEVIEKIHYFNTRPDAYAKRIYTVQCTMEQGKVVSNEFVVTASIRGVVWSTFPTTSRRIQEREPGNSLSKLQMSIDAAPTASVALPLPSDDSAQDSSSSEEVSKQHYEPSFDQIGGSRLQNILEMELPRPKALLSHHGYDMGGQGAVAGGAVAVVVVVCVGFLLVLLVVGVLKMRDTPMPRRHRKNRRGQQDHGMEWDDDGMNITVNPLDDVEKSLGGGAAYLSEDESSDDGDSECSYHDEEEMSEEEDEDESEILPVNHQAPPLEWDDEDHHDVTTPSTSRPLPGGSARPPSARSYRV